MRNKRTRTAGGKSSTEKRKAQDTGCTEVRKTHEAREHVKHKARETRRLRCM